MSQSNEVSIVVDGNKKVKDRQEDKSKSEEAENLIREIYDLRSAIYKYENDLNPARFGDVAESLPKCTLTSACNKAFHIPDVPTILKTELYKYGGINCVKIGDEFVFQFPVIINNTKERLYSVQIINNNGRGSLGKWVMPRSVDVNEIAKDHPLDDINNVRNFVRTCKHYISCYTYRQQQIYELKGYISDWKNCILETNMEFTRIILQLRGIKMISTGQVHDILLYLLYKPNEGLPCQMKIETILDEDELDEKTKKMLQKYFKKNFKKHNLKLAFEKIESNTSVCELKKIPKDISIIDLEDEDDQQAVEFLEIVRKRNSDKVKAKKNRSHDISRENDFSDEDQETSDESKLVERGRQAVSNGSVKPQKNKTTAKRNIEKGRADNVTGIPKKTAAKPERKRKLFGEKQQTLNFTKTSKSTPDIVNQTVSNRRKTIHVSEHVTDETWEANNNTPIKRFSHLSKRSEDFAKATEVTKKSAAVENAVVEKPTTANFPQKKTKKLGNILHGIRKSLHIPRNPNNISIDENKRRKSVRWQVDPIDNTNDQTLRQNTTKDSNTLMNSTPHSEALRNCTNIRPSFDHISEIVRNDKTPSGVLMANNQQQDAEDKSAASDSEKSECTEDRATLLRDLQLIREMKAPDIKSKKKVRANNERSRGKKSSKTRKSII